jgi:hypothetical protein
VRPDCLQRPPPARPRTEPGRRERVSRLMTPQAGHLPKRPTWSVTNPGSSSVRPQDMRRSADRRANQLRAARADANLGGNSPKVGQRGVCQGRLAPQNSCTQISPTLRQSSAGISQEGAVMGPVALSNAPASQTPPRRWCHETTAAAHQAPDHRFPFHPAPTGATKSPTGKAGQTSRSLLPTSRTPGRGSYLPRVP